ncbi:hypothetical protein ANANG_G00205310 [Anguilla anguilla]|uniref:Uncharacterized protein n=1 Tax=Anguilla anguilla TaxID=7936 RepID=A0A9D3M0R8_ANGAN|nr:hypothetical protein ANANG_G00205310 [Anguilla anguilla]
MAEIPSMSAETSFSSGCQCFLPTCASSLERGGATGARHQQEEESQAGRTDFVIENDHGQDPTALWRLVTVSNGDVPPLHDPAAVHRAILLQRQRHILVTFLITCPEWKRKSVSSQPQHLTTPRHPVHSSHTQYNTQSTSSPTPILSISLRFMLYEALF